MTIDLLGWLVLLAVGLLVPWLAWRSRSVLDAAGSELPLRRSVFFWQTAVFHLLLLGLGAAAARSNSLPLGFLPARTAGWWASAALLLVAGALLKIGWRRRTEQERVQLVRLLPQRGPEQLPFVVVCATASVGEEVVYRGAAMQLLLALDWPQPLAIAFLAGAFGAGHALQGWRSAAQIAAFGAAFHAVVIVSGGLLPAIAAHFVYDLYAGLAIPEWERQRMREEETRHEP